MSLTYEQAHDLASAAFQAYSLPDEIVIEETSGFSSESTAIAVDFSKPIYYYNKDIEHLLDTDDFCTSTAYFNVKIDLTTAEIEDAYFITQNGGNILGELTDDGKRAAYEAAGLSELLPRSTAPGL